MMTMIIDPVFARSWSRSNSRVSFKFFIITCMHGRRCLYAYVWLHVYACITLVSLCMCVYLHAGICACAFLCVYILYVFVLKFSRVHLAEFFFLSFQYFLISFLSFQYFLISFLSFPILPRLLSPLPILLVFFLSFQYFLFLNFFFTSTCTHAESYTVNCTKSVSFAFSDSFYFFFSLSLVVDWKY